MLQHHSTTSHPHYEESRDGDMTEIAIYIDDLGWSPRYLAERLGIGERGVWRWMNGQNDTPEHVLNWLKLLADFHAAHPLPHGWVSEKP